MANMDTLMAEAGSLVTQLKDELCIMDRKYKQYEQFKTAIKSCVEYKGFDNDGKLIVEISKENRVKLGIVLNDYANFTNGSDKETKIVWED